jgi:hypothetical protein
VLLDSKSFIHVALKKKKKKKNKPIYIRDSFSEKAFSVSTKPLNLRRHEEYDFESLTTIKFVHQLCNEQRRLPRVRVLVGRGHLGGDGGGDGSIRGGGDDHDLGR